ncbi:hypothetical protein [Vibrio phage 5 TSL-2019]|uniref:Uncharacterized protein n=1 Tax=Vibrio phage 5 TSL-2019 TaxID=2578086 RepID=A0A513SPL7_9CAUD|nr:hypothetical protein [Vibrio phage 5 TSL-2019]
MLIKKIDNTDDLPKVCDGYRRGKIMRHEGETLLTITIVAGVGTPFFHLSNSVCKDPKEALTQLTEIDRDFRRAEVYGNFSPEVVAHLREHNYYVNLIPCPVFKDIKKLSLYRVDDVDELEFQEHIRIGSVFMDNGRLTYQQSEKENDTVDAVLVSIEPINTIEELMEVLKLISTRVKKANVYLQCGNGLSKLMTEKGMVHHVY